MLVNTLKVHNYRCISKLSLESLAPITVLVGRNNTGKSALLECFALASTSEGGWYDALGTDLIESIVERRGGWEHADMMIKIGEQEAKVQISGESISGNMQIVSSFENLSEDSKDNFSKLFGDYVDSIARRAIERIDRLEKPSVAMRSSERMEMLFGRMKTQVLQHTRAFFSYSATTNKVKQFAAAIGETEELARLLDSFREIAEVYPMRYFMAKTIRSPQMKHSKTVFMLTPSPQYLKELQKSLAKSGELISLVELMRERVSYFTDIREVDKDFLVFLKGLKRPVPLDSMGDGFRAKLAILAAIMNARNGVILMEEPETRLHPGFMSSIADQIAETAANGEAQYVISTHSSDFLRFLLEANSELLGVVKMYRIEKTAEIDYEVLSGKEALEQVKELAADLRGI